MEVPYYTLFESPIGQVIVACNDYGVLGVWFKDARYVPKLEGEYVDNSHEKVKYVVEWIEKYFDGEAPDFSKITLCQEGSAFRQMVWEELCKIPYGKTTTYGTIAKQLATKTGTRVAAQAVGGAVGHNAISLLVPCHRVLGVDGELVGYAGGVNRKKYLLDLESEKRRNNKAQTTK